MKYRKFGNTDIELSVICLGTMTWGQQNSEQEGHEQLDYALSAGINFIDTAELYSVPGRAETQGSTERIIGNWIEKRKNRDQFFLATKVTGPSPNLKYIRNPLNFTSGQIRQALKGSLHRLKTDYVDLYQLHWPERKTNFFGVRNYRHEDNHRWEDNFFDILTTFKELINEGKVRYFGISNETPWGLSRFLNLSKDHELPRCMSVQNPYSLLNRTYEIGMAEMSSRESVGLLAYSPMAFGLLSGKYHDGSDTSRSRLKLFEVMSRYNGENSFKAAGQYAELAKKYGYSPAEMSLAFVNQQAFVTSNIIGATTMSQLKENINTIDIELPGELLNEINIIQEQIPNPAP